MARSSSGKLQLSGGDVPKNELGYPPDADEGTKFRAVNAYAVKQGFVGGFPNFFYDDVKTSLWRYSHQG